jgi:flavin-binding protein dodecin
MNEHVYKTIEITGSSHKGPDDAIRVAIEKASKTVHNMRWFKVIETRGNIEKDKVEFWQVTLSLGFTLE